MIPLLRSSKRLLAPSSCNYRALADGKKKTVNIMVDTPDKSGPRCLSVARLRLDSSGGKCLRVKAPCHLTPFCFDITGNAFIRLMTYRAVSAFYSYKYSLITSKIKRRKDPRLHHRSRSVTLSVLSITPPSVNSLPLCVHLGHGCYGKQYQNKRFRVHVYFCI